MCAVEVALEHLGVVWVEDAWGWVGGSAGAGYDVAHSEANIEGGGGVSEEVVGISVSKRSWCRLGVLGKADAGIGRADVGL